MSLRHCSRMAIVAWGFLSVALLGCGDQTARSLRISVSVAPVLPQTSDTAKMRAGLEGRKLPHGVPSRPTSTVTPTAVANSRSKPVGWYSIGMNNRGMSLLRDHLMLSIRRASKTSTSVGVRTRGTPRVTSPG